MVKQHVLAESDSEEPKAAPTKHKRLRRSNASEDDSGTNSEAILSDAFAKTAPEEPPKKKKAARKQPATATRTDSDAPESSGNASKKASSRSTGRSASAREALHAKHLSAYADQTVLRIKPDAELSSLARAMFADLAKHLMRRLTEEAFSTQVKSGKKILHAGTMASAVHLVAPNRMLAKVATDRAALRICASGPVEREGLVRAVTDMQC